MIVGVAGRAVGVAGRAVGAGGRLVGVEFTVGEEISVGSSVPRDAGLLQAERMKAGNIRKAKTVCRKLF
jgi:hypothetical protein